MYNYTNYYHSAVVNLWLKRDGFEEKWKNLNIWILPCRLSCSGRCQQMSQRADGPRCCRGFTMATFRLSHPGMCQGGPWQHSLSSSAPWCSRPAALFRRWLITVLMKCDASGNVTRVTWACQRGPAGSSPSHTDIWKVTEHQLLSLPVLVSGGSYVTLCSPSSLSLISKLLK